MGTQARHLDQHSAVATQAPPARWRRSGACLVLAFTGVTLGLLSLRPQPPALLWNYTQSVPVGIYSVTNKAPTRGDVVVIAPTGQLRATLEAYHAIPAGRLLLKQLAATMGDTVCRDGGMVTINGAPAAVAKYETAGRALPAWSGCRRLGADEILVLTGHAGSFDGRYFGPIGADQIVGIAHPLVTFPVSQEIR